LTWEVFYRSESAPGRVTGWILPALIVLALTLLVLGLPALENLTRQWKWTWGLALVAIAGLLAGELYFAPHGGNVFAGDSRDAGYHWLCSLVLFVFCLFQIQAGVHARSRFMVNLGVAFVALHIIAVYVNLFGSMARTGLMFLISGVFLIVFGIFLEKRRRALVLQIRVAH
jgi:uncharacterized membrane protein